MFDVLWQSHRPRPLLIERVERGPALIFDSTQSAMGALALALMAVASGGDSSLTSVTLFHLGHPARPRRWV